MILNGYFTLSYSVYVVAFCEPTETERTRSPATAERQRVSYTRLSRLTHWPCTSL